MNDTLINYIENDVFNNVSDMIIIQRFQNKKSYISKTIVISFYFLDCNDDILYLFETYIKILYLLITLLF